MDLTKNLLTIFLGGSEFVLYLLIFLSIFTIATIFERIFIFYQLRHKFLSMTTKELLLKAQKRLTFLATVGSNAPFIGLFGTVLGVIKAFDDLSKHDDFGIKIVMSGISEALIATAMGLFVAIPAVIAYNYFNKKLQIMLILKDSNEN